jgi:CDP-paratose 2-epimerase
MAVVLITGSGGLIGSEAALYYGAAGFDVVGVDNNMRSYFFGAEASTRWNRERVANALKKKYHHFDVDIRDNRGIEKIFKRYQKEIALVIHTAAQPSHDWAAKEPFTDFSVNATGTLVMLESLKRFCPQAVFIFTSTNKVYGDEPNRLPLIEKESRYEIDPSHAYQNGIPETMSVDQNMHSLFGVSKLAADALVQEYGRYFGLKTVCFRGGVLTGPQHSGAKLHGFLSYLMKCAMTETPYTIIGYKGKQVRDVIHSNDVIKAFDAFFKNPKSGAVYNLGGGRKSNLSVLEAVKVAEQVTGKTMLTSYDAQNRMGDHIWYISDLERFKKDYPAWDVYYTPEKIAHEIYEVASKRWK